MIAQAASFSCSIVLNWERKGDDGAVAGKKEEGEQSKRVRGKK